MQRSLLEFLQDYSCQPTFVAKNARTIEKLIERRASFERGARRTSTGDAAF